MTYDSYRYMYDNTFRDISDNSARAAKAAYNICEKYYMPTNAPGARIQTKELIAHAERGVAGLLNRFYYVGWLNH